MTDTVSKEQRSYIMSRIPGKWTSIEKRFHNSLKGNRIRHRMHPAIEGRPDIILPDYKIAIFLDGCFWHACPMCKGGLMPSANKSYWVPKIERTIKRDKNNSSKLRKDGWVVVRFWEHDINNNLGKCTKKLESKILCTITNA